jgi:very-short-patch-repair endonuclease
MNYIVDFFCKELCLVIEVDGITHFEEATYVNDMKRQKELERAGFKVVRFTDEEVLKNIDAVRTTLEHTVDERQKELRSASPQPPRRGGE